MTPDPAAVATADAHLGFRPAAILHYLLAATRWRNVAEPTVRPRWALAPPAAGPAPAGRSGPGRRPAPLLCRTAPWSG